MVAVFEIQYRAAWYGSLGWNVAEYLALFGLVLVHEFGHALACRQVGGRADHIMLWPLGGVALVAPPPRPGAWLWSIAAGPLVNLVLVPVFVAVSILADSWGWPDAYPDACRFVRAVGDMNFVLLLFNLLPVYPLDGGQILRSLLWFFVGPAKSLFVVSVIGLMVGSAVVVAALALGDLWLVVIAVFVALRSVAGFREARGLSGPDGSGPPSDPAGASEEGGTRSSPLVTAGHLSGDPAAVEARCEECRQSSWFPARDRGTVQTCPYCRASIDVGRDEDEEEWWKAGGEPKKDR